MTALPYKYRVTFAHQDDKKPDDDPNRHGWGELEYDSELPVVTQTDLKDVARWIGHKYNFTAVGIVKIDEIVDGELDDTVQSITSLPETK